jgi:hypothetical protein
VTYLAYVTTRPNPNRFKYKYLNKPVGDGDHEVLDMGSFGEYKLYGIMSGLSITWTPCIFLAYFGDILSRRVVEVGLNFSGQNFK